MPFRYKVTGYIACGLTGALDGWGIGAGNVALVLITTAITLCIAVEMAIVEYFVHTHCIKKP